MLESHLTPDCVKATNMAERCECREPVKQAPWGTWYITMGHAGFNSPANNAQGYATKNKAVAAYNRYSSRGKVPR